MTTDAPDLPLDAFDPFDPAYLKDPYPTLARIQRTTPALHVAKAGGFYLVSRYADVVSASKRHDVFSSTGGVGVEWKSRPMMPMYDPPKHTQLRRLVATFFTPRTVQAYAAIIRQAAEECVTNAIEQGQADVVHGIAEPVSLATLAAVLGVPKERREDLRRWADNTMADLAGGASEQEAPRLEASRKEFVGYLRGSIEERRRSDREDVISVLLRANDAERLTEKEVVAFCVLLLVAGFEPSASAIANTCRTLTEHCPRLDALPSSEDGLATAMNELLRWDSPVQTFFRNALVDTSVGGVVIPAGSKVMIHFAAANRDPRTFVAPDTLDLARTPNPHIAFGAGIHHCLGATLAQLQLTTFLDVLRTRVQYLELREPEQRKDNLLFRNLSRYVLRFVAR